MTPTEQAARRLANVERYGLCPVDGKYISKEGNWVRYDDALAAIARHLAPGDDLVERCAAMQAAHDSENIMEAIEKIADLPDRIAALTAQFEATQESHLHSDSLRLKAQAEAATLRARLAQMEGALGRINDKALMNAGEFPRYVRDQIAALSDGGSNG